MAWKNEQVLYFKGFIVVVGHEQIYITGEALTENLTYDSR